MKLEDECGKFLMFEDLNFLFEAFSRFRYSLFQVSAAALPPPKLEKSSNMPLNRGYCG
ncbi:hypothetical protein MKS83_04310 [Chryseobacterium sp. Y16C]|uniref:hypothetical protein n=1 Tax=Chryseobacterium sp. Y16C TaxID=2920939 RepID=UPI001F0A3BDA|nr:hypothetical protein [Chryseobacterium sp. Y16C]UMQ42914.1 hypothetical protein MKS83_04310 [Chryseobacterium sp. Y16C]